jgi:ABC-type transport system involved in Fe-S cluster assembly fused permease/ATPase subunit
MLLKLEQRSGDLSTIITDGFDGTTFLGFLAAGFLFVIFRLLINEGITAVIVALEIIRGRFPAKITINALVVHVVFARGVLGISICSVSHKKSF